MKNEMVGWEWKIIANDKINIFLYVLQLAYDLEQG